MFGARKRALALFARANTWQDTPPQQVLRVRYQTKGLTFAVNSATSMESVIRAFAKNTGTPEDATSLLYRGSPVMDSDSVGSLSIEDGDEVVAVVL